MVWSGCQLPVLKSGWQLPGLNSGRQLPGLNSWCQLPGLYSGWQLPQTEQRAAATWLNSWWQLPGLLQLMEATWANQPLWKTFAVLDTCLSISSRPDDIKIICICTVFYVSSALHVSAPKSKRAWLITPWWCGAHTESPPSTREHEALSHWTLIFHGHHTNSCLHLLGTYEYSI